MVITQLPERSLRLPEVQQLVPYSKMHIDRLEKAGEFPKRIKIGAGRVIWKQSEIIAWLESKRTIQAAA
jgi:prophage regulatory protein